MVTRSFQTARLIQHEHSLVRPAPALPHWPTGVCMHGPGPGAMHRDRSGIQTTGADRRGLPLFTCNRRPGVCLRILYISYHHVFIMRCRASVNSEYSRRTRQRSTTPGRAYVGVTAYCRLAAAGRRRCRGRMCRRSLPATPAARWSTRHAPPSAP